MKERDKKIDKPKKRIIRWKWCIEILFITLVLSFSLSLLSELLLSSSGSLLVTLLSVGLLILFILIGVFCDMIGVAMARADASPFMAMASKKIRGAKETISLLKNADKASSFFCDIVGDASGIICGAIGAAIVGFIMSTSSFEKVLVGALMSGIIAGATVFGKAVGKSIAIANANKIVFGVGKFVSFFKRSK